jgi:phage gp36-like protein
MAYLKKSDYTLRISVLHLDEILDEGAENSGLTTDTLLSNAEKWAVATIKSYLKTKYDIDAELAKDAAADPDTRNSQIEQVIIDFTLFTLHKTINPRQIPGHIQDAYDAAFTWLKEARDGLIVVDLPLAVLPEGEKEIDNTFIESQQKFISKPFTDLSLFDK